MMLRWTEWVDWPWWISVFFVVGVLATVWAFATMFLALGRRPRRLTVYDRPPAGSARFLESVSGLLNEPLQSGGEIDHAPGVDVEAEVAEDAAEEEEIAEERVAHTPARTRPSIVDTASPRIFSMSS